MMKSTLLVFISIETFKKEGEDIPMLFSIGAVTSNARRFYGEINSGGKLDVKDVGHLKETVITDIGTMISTFHQWIRNCMHHAAKTNCLFVVDSLNSMYTVPMVMSLLKDGGRSVDINKYLVPCIAEMSTMFLCAGLEPDEDRHKYAGISDTKQDEHEPVSESVFLKACYDRLLAQHFPDVPNGVIKSKY